MEKLSESCLLFSTYSNSAGLCLGIEEEDETRRRGERERETGQSVTSVRVVEVPKSKSVCQVAACFESELRTVNTRREAHAARIQPYLISLFDGG